MNHPKMLLKALAMLLCLTAFPIQCHKIQKSPTPSAKAKGGQIKTGNEDISGECSNNETKLVLVQVIFRHGDRTPLFSWPKDPYNLKDPKTSNNTVVQALQRRGMLTKRGLLQSHELGIFLATRYKDFLQHIWIPEDLHVQASEVERTIMTAQTVLAGLFPPHHCPKDEPGGCEHRWSKEVKWQPIPVYPITKKYDNKINFIGSYKSCPAYVSELEAVLGSECMQAFIATHEKTFDDIEEQTGLPNVDIRNIGLIYDTLYIQNLYELPLPNWTKSYFPVPLQELEELGFQILSSNRAMMRFNGGPLLKEVIHNMKRAAGYSSAVNQTCEKIDGRQKILHLYSGHDTTVAAFLATLDLLHQHQPAYTSAVIVELHETIKEKACGINGSLPGANEHIVKVFYRNASRGALKELMIKQCGNPCHLDKLEEISKDLFVSNWKRACHGSDNFFGWIFGRLRNLIASAFRTMISYIAFFWEWPCESDSDAVSKGMGRSCINWKSDGPANEF